MSLSGANLKPAALAAAGGARNASLCFERDVGGEMLSICNVLGYEMPGFIFYASTFIFLLFLASSVSLTRQCMRVATAMNRITAKLSKLPKPQTVAPSRTLTAVELTDIRSLMQSEPVSRDAWARFEETLLVSETGPRGDAEVYSTSSPDTVLSKAALIEENVHTAFFNAIPGILTGVGLLMTFVAILDGLSHVSVAENMDVKGIGGLINGLSGKFVSSIVAVTCAVSFVFVERIAYSQPQKAYGKLLSQIVSRFRARTAEHLLYSLETQLKQQMAMQRDFLQSLGAAASRGGKE